QESVPQRVPEEEHAVRAAQEARAEDDVCLVGEDGRQELWILGGVVLEVRILDEDDVARRGAEAGADGGPLPLIDRVLDEPERPLAPRRDLPEELAGAVRGAVVDDDHLPLDLRRKRRRRHPAQEILHRGALVVRRDDDREARHGAGVYMTRERSTGGSRNADA